MSLTYQPSSNSHHSPKYGGEIDCAVAGAKSHLNVCIGVGNENYVCDDTIIFWRGCRMIDFYVGNAYILINRRFSELDGFIKNY